MCADICLKTVSIQCCPLNVYPRLRPRLIESLNSTEEAHRQKMCLNVCWHLEKNCLYSMLPPYGMSPVKASTHRKIKLNPISPSTKNVCECVLIFGWKSVSIQYCPLIVYPRFRRRLIEKLISNQKAHQQKMCVNVCRYLCENCLYSMLPPHCISQV